jgi:hypothetical protein
MQVSKDVFNFEILSTMLDQYLDWHSHTGVEDFIKSNKFCNQVIVDFNKDIAYLRQKISEGIL